MIHDQFRNHVHNQTDFGNPFINGRGFIYLGISNISPNMVGSYKSRFKFLNLNVTRATRNVATNQRYHRFPSVGDYIHATPTFEHTWGTPGHTVIRGS